MSVERIFRITDTFISRLSFICMTSAVASMAVLIMLSVIVRNLMGFSLQWIVDVNRLIFVWMCFTGIVYINSSDAFIRFDILEKRFSPAVSRLLKLAFDAGSLALFLIMTRSGLEVSEFAKAQVFSTIPVSTKWLYLAVVCAGAFLSLQTVMRLATGLFHIIQPKQSGFSALEQ